MPTSASRRLVPLATAAEYASCSINTIRRRVADGTLSAVRFGPRMIRVDLDELDAIMRPIPSARIA